ncbi:MAG: DUF1844 domain-containing protein [bacterium]|jgi:hypothetical protein|nr:DUF1844 domain-containing protein [candidate division KSB1 bacterium]MDH7558779.1 DUF1844 domain-containing protein [bacterium]
MAEQFTREQMFEALFFNLVMMFHTSAMQYMGKLKNPLTDKIERDLLQAQMSIDMLDMLKAKTKGNLTDNEARFLDRMISELKLNYVDEAEKDRKAQEQQAKTEGEKKESASAGAETTAEREPESQQSEGQ